MHFVTGGAFNGKRKWVKQFYPSAATWFSASEHVTWPTPGEKLQRVVILEGVESWVKQEINPAFSADEILDRNIQKAAAWLDWEQSEENRILVFIGTDISKGIVPIEKENRLHRDVNGWFYQKLVEHAERVDMIWYGISETLK